MTDDAYREMLLEIWETALPALEERVTMLAAAAAAAASGSLDDGLRKEGASAAHKLSGSLGTFGYAELGRLASEAEGMLDGHDALETNRLSEIVSALTAIVGAGLGEI